MEGVEVECSTLLPKEGEVRGEVRQVVEEGRGGERGWRGGKERHQHLLPLL